MHKPWDQLYFLILLFMSLHFVMNCSKIKSPLGYRIDQYSDSLHCGLQDDAAWSLLCSFVATQGMPPGTGLEPPTYKVPKRWYGRHQSVRVMTNRTPQQKSSTNSSSKNKRGKRVVTPKCGACKTCQNPRMKKACLTNRERIAQGMEPVFIQEPPKLE